MLALRLVRALFVAGVGAESWEEVVHRASAKVHGEVDPAFRVREVFTCHHNPEQQQQNCWRMSPMSRLEDARYMRVAYCKTGSSSPNVLVTVNLTTVPATLDLAIHHNHLLEDQDTKENFPPQGLDFKGALAKVRRAFGDDLPIYQMSWRRPLHPCVSEDLFQFVLGDRYIIVSVGSQSHRVCLGQATQHSYPMCGEPRCVDGTENATQAFLDVTDAIAV